MVLLGAAAAAAVYYSFLLFSYSVLLLFGASITALSLCRALLTVHRHDRRLHALNAAVHALCIGAVIGFTAGFPRPARWGMPQERITGLYGTIANDPMTFSDGRGRLAFIVNQSVNAEEARVSAYGQVLVLFPADYGTSLKTFGRGTQAFIEGRFIPGAEGLFAADALYMTKPASFVDQARTSIRMQVFAWFADSAWGGLSLALILGIKDKVDTQLAQNYQKAGSSHVLALSGMHLSLIIALLSLLLKRAVGLKVSAVLGALFIVGYVYLVGDLPSLNRAAVMYLLVTYAIIMILPKKPSVFLAMSFLIQIIGEPKTGMTLSFILSYSALAGILVFGPVLSQLMKGRLPAKIAAPLSASLGAFIATAAITAGVFGILYPVGILAGLIIVPLTEVFIIFSFLFLSFCPFPALANFLCPLLELLYRSLEYTVSFFAQAPGIPVQNTQAVILITALLGAGIVLLKTRCTEEGKAQCL
ncbi:MAG: ComEC/Rec2 family competence protein [Spirochaetaceae bacterium]|jgi:competence protein ComEC|nr:ComEC/Rec2 family competence protein [Spirochaetaceae bacterium]